MHKTQLKWMCSDQSRLFAHPNSSFILVGHCSAHKFVMEGGGIQFCLSQPDFDSIEFQWHHDQVTKGRIEITLMYSAPPFALVATQPNACSRSCTYGCGQLSLTFQR